MGRVMRGDRRRPSAGRVTHRWVSGRYRQPVTGPISHPDTDPAEPAEPAAGAPATRVPAKLGPVGNTIVVVIVIAIVAFCAFGNHGGDSKDKQSAKNADATSACEKFVKDDLKSPASAQFSGEDVSHDGSIYTVTGDVDSDNSFGALIRNSFTCTIRDDDTVWTLVSMDGLVN